ncbi:hypothetical protein F183_A06110 [Bryobacterales bacterium F-183]|nr:hypothetical protein F183_A06110 [Bryobacterales bacterium F-183]
MFWPPVLLALSPEAWLNIQCATGEFTGAAAIRRQGRTVLQKACGDGNTVQTAFRIASITKQFTAVAILILQQQGKLRIGDPIARHLPDLPELWQSATIHQLLTHTSGIPSYTGDSLADLDRRGATPSQLLDLVRAKPLSGPHGDRMRYNNTGYVLLGRIIEKTSGVAYHRFIETRLFRPLKMRKSKFDSDNSAAARGRIKDGKPAPLVDATVPWAAGGFRSTVADLLSWAENLNQLLTPESQRLRTAIYPETQLQNMHYGYGVVLANRHGHPLEYHGGGITGFTTVLHHYPADKLSIVVLSNLDGDAGKPPAWEVADELFRRVLDSP